MPDRWSASNGEGVWYGRSRRTAVIHAHRGERPLSLQSCGPPPLDFPFVEETQALTEDGASIYADA